MAEHRDQDSRVPWYALVVKPQHEKTVSRALREKGYPELLPLYKARRRWVSRSRDVSLPLFPQYVFCQFDPHCRLPVLQIPSVKTIVKFGGTLTPMKESEILAVKAVVDSGLTVAPHEFLSVGTVVRVTSGPLTGVEGILKRVKGTDRLVVSVTLLQQSMAVEIDRQWVVPLPNRKTPTS